MAGENTKGSKQIRNEPAVGAAAEDSVEVLVVGAGPTGLVLALLLARFGVHVRIVDMAGGPGQASRAMAVQARTLEFYQQMGFAQEIVDRSIIMQRVHLWRGEREIATLEFGDIGQEVSPFPFALSYPQDEHERFLGERLQEAGIFVEWNTQLVGLDEEGSVVLAHLRRGDVDHRAEATYVCGCDGAHSAVRRLLGLGFPGGTYQQHMYVADVEAEGPATGDGINGRIERGAFLAAFPIRTSGMHRLIGVVPDSLQGRDDVSFDQIKPFVEKIIAFRIKQVNWASIYKVHHRVADSFRSGRTFLLGDAGHVHSPAGGQGMNTGIGDSVNLAWKLAQALRSGSVSLLDSYEPERIAFARRLVQTTDRGFQVIVGNGLVPRFARGILIPHILPVLLGLRRVRLGAYRMISQTAIQYRESPLSIGRAGRLRAGDRLPWTGDNFEALKSMSWQIHVYGKASAELDALSIPVHEFVYTPRVAAAGFFESAMYVVRPDGYIGLASERQDIGTARDYIARHC